jgi:hypothetical protein
MIELITLDEDREHVRDLAAGSLLRFTDFRSTNPEHYGVYHQFRHP